MRPGSCSRLAPEQILIISTSGRCALLELVACFTVPLIPWRRRRPDCCCAMQADVWAGNASWSVSPLVWAHQQAWVGSCA